MTRALSHNFLLDNDDLRFQLSRLDWATLMELQESAFDDADAFKNAAEARAFYEDVLRSLGELIAKEIAPHERELDEQHPVLKDGEVEIPARMKKIKAQLQEMGALCMTLPRRLGGMNPPLITSNVLMELLARADASVTGEVGFHGGIAQAL